MGTLKSRPAPSLGIEGWGGAGWAVQPVQCLWEGIELAFPIVMYSKETQLRRLHGRL
ncbi:hypothetical protein J7444_20480 [Labrenzia sp. R4_1]|uniref:hypothetical protein n=1 Tax=Labrenzia sp. R4_1 TaxID=2821106 RepID=UPI001ADBDB5D|nr:hypothetical protein [Labrenzia sp. R4_1]MBO9427123.1 hypothetical protein [Labrenzia sp. R4_1]